MRAVFQALLSLSTRSLYHRKKGKSSTFEKFLRKFVHIFIESLCGLAKEKAPKWGFIFSALNIDSQLVI